MPKPKTKNPPEKEPKKFVLSLDLGGLVFKAEADTLQEALTILQKDSFGKIKSWGIFILKTGRKKAQIRYSPIQIKRAFFGSLAQDIFFDRLIALLK